MDLGAKQRESIASFNGLGGKTTLSEVFSLS